MKDTIFLVASRNGVSRMTKSMPTLKRGEIPCKVEVLIQENAFREPVLVRKIEITDWREGIDVGSDLELRTNFITEEEADMIRARRLERMAAVLKEHGYGVTEPPAAEGEDHG